MNRSLAETLYDVSVSPDILGATERALAALGHLDVLDDADSMSPARGLGRRALKAFGAVFTRELAELESRLAGARGPRALALRGRLRRLRGDLPGARADLSRAAAAAPRDARTLAWLGELDSVVSPGRAARRLERAAALDPADGHARMWLGLARLELKRFSRADRDFDAALERFARPPHVLLLLKGAALFHRGDFKGAAAAAERAVAADPASPAGHVLLSSSRHRQGRAVAAQTACHRARDRDLEVGASYLLPEFGPDPWTNALAYLRRLDRAIGRRPSALLLAERGELKRDPRICRYEEALQDYEAAARRAPGIAWIRALVGRARNNAAGGEAGLADFDRAVALEPDSGWIRAWRGAALARLGRAAPAFADFDSARRLMPWYPYTYAWRGALLVRADRHGEACADLDRAVLLDPDYIFARFERFKARLGAGDIEGAVADLVAARRADPKFDWPGLEPGAPAAAVVRGRALLRKALRARPELGWLRAWRGRLLLAEGRFKGALVEFDAAARKLPGEADPRVWRGEALARLGKASAARRALEEAARLSPRAWSAHKALADMLAARGLKREALSRMRRVTALAPTTVTHLVDQARLEAALKRPKEALKSLERALELDPRYTAARALAARTRWALGDHAGAERDAEAALASSDAPAMALIVRAAARAARGDVRGQASDFKRALELEPELFSPEQRQSILAAT